MSILTTELFWSCPVFRLFAHGMPIGKVQRRAILLNGKLQALVFRDALPRAESLSNVPQITDPGAKPTR